MRCSQCDREIPDSEGRFCPFCGAVVIREAFSPAAPLTTRSGSNARQSANSPNSAATAFALVVVLVGAFFGWQYWQEEQRKAEGERKEQADRAAAAQIIRERGIRLTTSAGEQSFSIEDVIDRWNPKDQTFVVRKGALWGVLHSPSVGRRAPLAPWTVERRQGPIFAVSTKGIFGLLDNESPGTYDYSFDVDIAAHTIRPANDLSERLLALDGSRFTGPSR